MSEAQSEATATGDGFAPTSLHLAMLRLKATGVTDVVAARTLNIAERTLRRHLGDLMKAVGARSRSELFLEAGRRGWLG